MLLGDADKLYLGAAAASAAYCGTVKVWPLGSAPPFAPGDIANLQVWIDASQLSQSAGQAIPSFANLAGTSTTLNVVGTPAPKVSTGTKNGRKLIRFTTNEGRLRSTNLATDNIFTFVYVASMVGPNGVGRIVNSIYPNGHNYLVGYWNGFQDVAYGDAAFYTPDVKVSVVLGAWKMYSADCTPTPSYLGRMFSNGVEIGSGTVATGNFNQCLAISGFDLSTTDETCDFEFAEFVLYNRKLSDAERQQVEGYLRTKWGI